MKPVRMGVLGCASIARRRLLPAMAASQVVDIAAVASRDPATARSVAAQWGCRPVTGYDAVLASADVDAVYVPLPLALHAPWVEAALRAGKHVLAEKPLTMQPRATARLLALARRHGLALMENVMFVHHAQHAAIRRLLADGVVGDVTGLRAEFTIPPLPADDIRYRADLGGGALADVGVYPVRAALLMLGLELDVADCVLRTSPIHGVVTSGAAALRARDGRTATLTFGMEHAYSAWYEVVGSAGRLRVDRAYAPPADHAPVITLTRGRDVTQLTLPPDDQVAGALAAFAAAVRSASAGAPTVPDRAVLRQAELLAELARVGGAAGRPQPDETRRGAIAR